MVSEIFRTLEIGWAWACLQVTSFNPGFQISNFLATKVTIFIISKKNIRTITSVVGETQFRRFWACPWASLKSPAF